jgi:hypothetical protein
LAFTGSLALVRPTTSPCPTALKFIHSHALGRPTRLRSGMFRPTSARPATSHSFLGLKATTSRLLAAKEIARCVRVRVRVCLGISWSPAHACRLARHIASAAPPPPPSHPHPHPHTRTHARTSRELTALRRAKRGSSSSTISLQTVLRRRICGGSSAPQRRLCLHGFRSGRRT